MLNYFFGLADGQRVADEIHEDAIAILADVRNSIDQINNLPKQLHAEKDRKLKQLRSELNDKIEKFKKLLD